MTSYRLHWTSCIFPQVIRTLAIILIGASLFALVWIHAEWLGHHADNSDLKPSAVCIGVILLGLLMLFFAEWRDGNPLFTHREKREPRGFDVQPKDRDR
jgi:xanthine/uracil permease